MRNCKGGTFVRSWKSVSARHSSLKDKIYLEGRDQRRKGSHGPRGTLKTASFHAVHMLMTQMEKSKVTIDDDNDDDDDNSDAHLIELEQIRKERAEEKLRNERQQQEEELKVKEAEVLRGNPLLNNPTSFNVKRRLVVWRTDFTSAFAVVL